MTPEKGEKPLAAQGDTNARAVPADRPDWINDPWYDLRPEQAWRAGWEAGLAAGYDAGFAASGEGWNGEYPSRAVGTDYYRERRAATIAAMEPPA